MPAAELLAVWDRHSDAVVSAVRAALAEAPPELSRDILEDGILLSGGAAMTGSLARRIRAATGIRTSICETPLHAVAGGLERMIEGR